MVDDLETIGQWKQTIYSSSASYTNEVEIIFTIADGVRWGAECSSISSSVLIHIDSTKIFLDHFHEESDLLNSVDKLMMMEKRVFFEDHIFMPNFRLTFFFPS